MPPKTPTTQTSALFEWRIDEIIKMSHPLVKLAKLIHWEMIEKSFAAHFASTKGRPALSPRLVAGLLYLQHSHDLSDEQVVMQCLENPYWQYFCGFEYFQTELPIDPSSLTRWRKRIGEEGVETLLAASIEAARLGKVIAPKSIERVIVDTTVMPKAVAHPTDSRLLEKSRIHLVKLAQEAGLSLRQNYNQEAPKLAMQIGRYAHAKQFKRMNKALKALKVRVARVWRDIERQTDQIPHTLQGKAADLLQKAKRIIEQKKTDKNKLYALHAPEVECISKGKSRTPYEFGVKVSLVTTHKEGLVIGCRSMPGNPYDGHTLEESLEQAGILCGTDRKPKTAIVDKGYKGVEIEGVTIYRSGQKRGITRTLKAMIKRRSAIEPTIGHMKMDGRLSRNPLKGALGDALHAVLCGAGHNIRLILKKLRLFCALLIIKSSELFALWLRQILNLNHQLA